MKQVPIGQGGTARKMPSFRCKDIGWSCGFEATATTEAELMKQIAGHAKEVHNMDRVPPVVMLKIEKAIKK